MTTLLTLLLLVALTTPARAQTPSPGTPDSRFTERLHQADTNGDGLLTPDEARAAHLWFSRDFGSVDADHSGTVTVFELSKALQQQLSRWLSDFDAADTDHDGQVSDAEAAHAAAMTDAFTNIQRSQRQAVSRQQYESYALDRIYRDSELPSVAPNILEKKF